MMIAFSPLAVSKPVVQAPTRMTSPRPNGVSQPSRTLNIQISSMPMKKDGMDMPNRSRPAPVGRRTRGRARHKFRPEPRAAAPAPSPPLPTRSSPGRARRARSRRAGQAGSSARNCRSTSGRHSRGTARQRLIQAELVPQRRPLQPARARAEDGDHRVAKEAAHAESEHRDRQRRRRRLASNVAPDSGSWAPGLLDRRADHGAERPVLGWRRYRPARRSAGKPDPSRGERRLDPMPPQ